MFGWSLGLEIQLARRIKQWTVGVIVVVPSLQLNTFLHLFLQLLSTLRGFGSVLVLSLFLGVSCVYPSTFWQACYIRRQCT